MFATLYSEFYKSKNALSRIAMFTLLILMATLINSNAYGTTTSTDPIGSAFCNLIKILQGNLVRGVCIVVVGLFGVGVLVGKVSWPTLAITVIGIIIITNPGTIVNLITGTSTASNCGVSTL